MEIKKLSKYKGEAQLGRCVECGEFETDFRRLYRLQFNGTSICLCPDCFRKTQIAMNKVIIEPQESWETDDNPCDTNPFGDDRFGG